MPGDSAFCKALIFGPGGNGKTHLLGTAQEDERTFPMAFLNWDSGESTLAGLDIDVFDIKVPKDFDDLYADLKSGKLRSKITGGPFKSVGVDSITETQVNALLQILDMDRERADPDLLAQQDWGVVLIRMRRIARRFMKLLPMHVFMTALAAETSVRRLGMVKIPSVQGSFKDELPGVPDVLAYLAQENVEADPAHPDGIQRVLLLHSNPTFGVKARTPWGQTIPSEIADPSVGKLLDTLGYANQEG